MKHADIDVRSDVYSLGVTLYELLTGTTPLDPRRLKDGGLSQALRMVRETQPPPPSQRLQASGEFPAIAGSRATEPRRLISLVRGELDWIAWRRANWQPSFQSPITTWVPRQARLILRPPLRFQASLCWRPAPIPTPFICQTLMLGSLALRDFSTRSRLSHTAG